MKVNIWTCEPNPAFLALAPGTMSPAWSVLQRSLMHHHVKVVPRVLFSSNAGLWIPDDAICQPFVLLIVTFVPSLRHVWLIATRWTAARQIHLSPLSPRICSITCPSSQWCQPTISFSAIPFSFCLQSLPVFRQMLSTSLSFGFHVSKMELVILKEQGWIQDERWYPKGLKHAPPWWPRR